MDNRSAKPESSANVNGQNSPIDDQIRECLNKLKENNAKEKEMKQVTDADLAERLLKIKGDQPITLDGELHARLAKLKGIPVFESKV